MTRNTERSVRWAQFAVAMLTGCGDPNMEGIAHLADELLDLYEERFPTILVPVPTRKKSRGVAQEKHQ